jgi:hypothetical protein
MDPHPEANVNAFYEILFFTVRVYLVACVLLTIAVIGSVVYDRYVNGNVDAFKPERRVGPADRRARLSGH